MLEISESPENPKTPEGSTKGNGNASGWELTRKQMQAKIKRISRKIASLKKKSERSIKVRDIMPTKLNFDGENGRKEDGNPEKGDNPVENDKENSPAASLSVFDCLGKKLT